MLDASREMIGFRFLFALWNPRLRLEHDPRSVCQAGVPLVPAPPYFNLRRITKRSINILTEDELQP